MSKRLTLLLVILVAMMVAAYSAGPVLAADSRGESVSITGVDATKFPLVRLGFGADESTGAIDAISVYENGQRVSGVSVYHGELGRFQEKSYAELILALDSSLSMSRGTRLDDALDAARAFIGQADDRDKIGLVTFGGESEMVIKPTRDHREVLERLDGIDLATQTRMFDGVELAAKQLEKSDTPRRAVILLSDGDDLGSSANLDEAVDAALLARAPVYSIAIRESSTQQPPDLARLSNGTSGELSTVTNSGELTNVFTDLGRRILQPYWIEYRSNAANRSRVEAGIALGSKAKRPDASIEYRATPAPSDAVAKGNEYIPPKVATASKPMIPVPGGSLGMLLAALPFGAMLFFVIYRVLNNRSTPDIVARIDRYTMEAKTVANARANEGSLLRNSGAPLVRMSESLLGSSNYFSRIRSLAEQANIAIKPAELFAAAIALGVTGGFFGMIAGGALGLIGGIAAGFLFPNLWLLMKARGRRKAFEMQLADVLSGIASSLEAGHSFNQAVAAIIKDTPNPTREEFNRVMTEARLGLPIEQGLQNMANRMGSSDFDFAVTTVNIQRTVGGSLSEILVMVADTVRNRQQFRQKVKALSAMGTASAYVLLAMPFIIGGVMSLISPGYITPLFTTPTGNMMLGAAGFSMVIGYFACMRVVKIKV